MKKILWTILIAAIYPSVALSCKCDTDFLDDFSSHPENAPVVFFGQVESIQSRMIAKSIKSWTSAPNQVYISGSDQCSHGHIGPSTYVLVLVKEVIKSENYIIDSCNSMLLRIHKNNIPLIHKLARKKDFSGTINPSWQFCQLDNECVQVKDKCGNSIGVNKKYQTDYLDFLKTRIEKADCSKKSGSVSVSKCVENFCS